MITYVNRLYNVGMKTGINSDSVGVAVPSRRHILLKRTVSPHVGSIERACIPVSPISKGFFKTRG